jgi:hypothetical protein
MSVEWHGQFTADDVSPLERAMVESARTDARAAAHEQREQAEREAERELRLESLTFAERQLGNPMANMFAARSAYAEATDEVAEARTRLEKAERRHTQARDNVEFWASRMQAATNLASRSAPSVTGAANLLAPARRAMAEIIREQDILRRAKRLQEQRRPRQRLARRSVTANGDGQRGRPPKSGVRLWRSWLHGLST